MRACYGTSGVIVVVKTGVRAESIPPAFGHGGFCGLNLRSGPPKEELKKSSGLDTKSYEEIYILYISFSRRAGNRRINKPTSRMKTIACNTRPPSFAVPSGVATQFPATERTVL